jgi:hypothetical protein
MIARWWRLQATREWDGQRCLPDRERPLRLDHRLCSRRHDSTNMMWSARVGNTLPLLSPETCAMPFTQTFVGGVIVAVVATLVSLAIQKGFFEREPANSSLVPSQQERARAADEQRQHESARTERARANAIAEREGLARIGADAEAQKQQRRRDAMRAAEEEALAKARRAKAYRDQNGGCDLGWRPQCMVARSTSGEVLADYGCSCVAD